MQEIESEASQQSYEPGDSWEGRDGSQMFQPDWEETEEASSEETDEITIDMEMQEELEGESRRIL